MTPISDDRAQRILELLRSCGQQAERMARETFDVFQKGPSDYVTSIDAALDRRLTEAFTTLFPEDGVITEENALSRKQFTSQHSRLWCIDPLDGTEDFIRGKRDYAVMVGLLEDYQPIAGWIYAPAQDQLYYGGPNWGVFQAVPDSSPLLIAEPPPPTSQFCPILIGYRDQKRYGSAIELAIPSAQFSSLGSFGLKVMEVIQGHAGLYVYLNGRVKIWDTAGPLALANAAGLVCCDLEGQAIRFSANSMDLDTLAHKQAILVGWPEYVEALLPNIQQAVKDVLES
ncbi:inositol monophosphatase family protein [Leptolyngbya sp. FACHB-36]|uniref:3'(2'),5'-bisphosphate nucleotidase CysQ family protein n=1 Tax=Leptolyngbya sp. FACHB-36 TaxID=2692808 RepID=UPI0016807E1D|nr:inositol monophosphatase family protein [Leptolyngbya sp. FACHB-36]MBD2020081.1 inositol monophosphatase family protein [Leptolyngbya sp. FACHB-36]